MCLGRTGGRVHNLVALLAVFIPLVVYAIQTRNDLCGLSMHTSDFPDVGDFSSIEATWTVPQVPLRWQDLGAQSQQTFQGVSLCCGDDCSTRLSAGFRAYSTEKDQDYTAEPIIFLSPQFAPSVGATGLNFTSSDTLRIRLEVLSSTRARVEYTKFVSPTKNHTASADVTIAQQNGTMALSFHIDGVGDGVTWEDTFSTELKTPNDSQPSFCGDSAWWYLSDSIDPWDKSNARPLTPARFSPLLIEDHSLGTTHGKSFPADLPLSGQARFWNLAREVSGKTQDVCQVKSFVDTGATLLRSPFVRDI